MNTFLAHIYTRGTCTSAPYICYASGMSALLYLLVTEPGLVLNWPKHRSISLEELSTYIPQILTHTSVCSISIIG
ncbi:hypothetical protein BJ508DRAFT_131271 [Ascobolus immersus RN42]|uniref:Uncharacterized protein n=1 Tax=Ascobolus immersus RN42 TaxID=1160509 RepID=A0A3N4I7T0_ASCIM|nr:hypothetical protein BJ508DRAFT_131271 [Ascobolus immersus RN42]